MEEEQLVGEFGHNDTNEQTIGAGHGRGRGKGEAEGERASGFAKQINRVCYAPAKILGYFRHCLQECIFNVATEHQPSEVRALAVPF